MNINNNNTSSAIVNDIDDAIFPVICISPFAVIDRRELLGDDHISLIFVSFPAHTFDSSYSTISATIRKALFRFLESPFSNTKGFKPVCCIPTFIYIYPLSSMVFTSHKLSNCLMIYFIFVRTLFFRKCRFFQIVKWRSKQNLQNSYVNRSLFDSWSIPNECTYGKCISYGTDEIIISLRNRIKKNLLFSIPFLCCGTQ